MRLRERTGEPDPQAERELEAIDAALAGRPVDPDLAGWAEFAEMLSEERPEADPDWSAELDQAVEQRFPRRPVDGRRGFASAIGSLMPRRMAPAVAGLATFAVVAVVAATTLSGGDGDDTMVSSEFQSIEGQGGALSTEQMPTTSDDAAAAGDSSGELAAPSAAPEPDVQGLESASGDSAFPRRDDGAISPGTVNRKVERDVTLALAAPPENVNAVSDEAIGITRDLDGIVASSNVRTAGEDATATLDLIVPTRNLDEAIDRLTEIGDVRSLEESSLDITRPYVTAQDELEDAEAERRGLIEALGNATTDEEAEAIRIQISDVRKEIARAEAIFDKLSRRAQLSDVSLTIRGDRDASSSKGDGGDKSLGDYLDDAEEVLKDIAGILLIAAAILVPAAILLTIAWLVISRTRRRRRERALD